MGIYAGVSVGPLVGGLTADTLGYRTSFLFTGACLLLGGLGISFFVHEHFEKPTAQAGKQHTHWWDGPATVLRSRDIVIVLTVRLLTRSGGTVLSPVLPLFVAALLPESSRVATVAGMVAGASAGASSIGAVWLGRMGDRIGYRRVLFTSAATTAAFYALQAAVTNVSQLVFLQICVGFALSGTISSLTALLATLAPDGQQGAVYGVETSVNSGANALGPMLGASLAVALGLRSAFLLAAGLFVLSAAVIGWLLPTGQPSTVASMEASPASRGGQT
jgi:DHA1 family multidrug resistance protein-like MFS transporter